MGTIVLELEPELDDAVDWAGPRWVMVMDDGAATGLVRGICGGCTLVCEGGCARGDL